uniref:Hydrolase n=1 Tax=Ignisphaera aggregans TaxID=334771 RepID=A0A7C5Z016_9CREN
MPFTTYHIASGLFAGYFLRKKVDWLTLVITTAIVADIEPILMVTGLLRDYPPHGFLHTYLASIPMGAISGFILYLIRSLLSPFMRAFCLNEGNQSLVSYISGGVLGWFLHVLMDSPLYIDIRPFYPLAINPLYGLLDVEILEILYNVMLLCGFTTYIIHFYNSVKHEGISSLLRVGSLSILIGFLISFQGFDIELGFYNKKLAVTGSVLVLIGTYLFLECLFKLRAISFRKATFVLLIIVVVIAALPLQIFPRITLVWIDYLLLVWLLLILVTILVRKSLNIFRLKMFRLRLPVGDLLVASIALAILIVGIFLLLLLLMILISGAYVYEDTFA